MSQHPVPKESNLLQRIATLNAIILDTNDLLLNVVSYSDPEQARTQHLLALQDLMSRMPYANDDDWTDVLIQIKAIDEIIKPEA